MSQTPRTDTECDKCIGPYVEADFARQLEKELTAKAGEADAMAEELKALRTQGKAVCEALEDSLDIACYSGDVELLGIMRKTLTAARVVFPK